MKFLIAKIIVQLHFKMNKTGAGHEINFSAQTTDIFVIINFTQIQNLRLTE